MLTSPRIDRGRGCAMPSARALVLRTAPPTALPPFGLRSSIADRAIVPSYHMGRENLCPNCGRSHWNMGRSSAECAFCCTALPFAGAW